LSDRTGAPVRSDNYFDYNLSGTFPNALPAGTYYLAADLGYSVVPAGQFIKF